MAPSAETVPELRAALRHPDPDVRSRAADAIEKVRSDQPALLQPFKAEILGLMPEAAPAAVRWHLAQLFPHLKLKRAERERAIAVLREHFKDRSSVVKTFAMQALCEIAAGDSALRDEMGETPSQGQSDWHARDEGASPNSPEMQTSSNCMRLFCIAVFLLASVSMAQINGPIYPYQNVTLTPEKRAADLVSRMTLDEKVLQMQSTAPAIAHLNVPAYDWWNEGLHGVARAGLATVFPQAIGLAAMWDTDLMNRVAHAISTEARAKYNQAQRDGNYSRYHGLTFWSPNINIFRDPRWGRGQETYGEDPYLTSRMALAFITGMQGNDSKYLKTVATAKHFAVHSGPEPLRHSFNVNPSPTDLESTYLPAFRASIVQGKAASVMCAYNAVNGVPACANTDLLVTHLRTGWGFQGYVVSDCGAITDIAQGHKYSPTIAAASAAAVLAGTDLTCGTEYASLPQAISSGLTTEAAIDRSLQRLFAARFRLGMFDPASQVAYAAIPYSENDSPAHRALALEAAQKSIVLLKNTMLPLTPVSQKIAVIGPAADEPNTLLGNYNGIPSKIVTPLDGIRNRFGQVSFALGSTYTSVSHALVSSTALTLQAEYFDNADLSGTPKLTRAESRIYLNWDMNDPAVVAAVPRNQFSVRWIGTLTAPYTGNYVIGGEHADCNDCSGTDSIRIYLDNNIVVDDSTPRVFPRQTQQAQVQLQAGQTYRLRVEYRQSGSGIGTAFVWIPPAAPLLSEAINLVSQSDLVLAFLGLNSDLEGEESPLDIPGFAYGDRTDIQLPAPQQALLKAALDSGKPVVVVLMTGSSIASADADQRAAAVLQAWYGGEEAGNAAAQVLAGDYNPAGRLPVTFYRSIDQLPAFTDYSLSGHTYRYFQGEPLYPFGYGLSYSKFTYSNLKMNPVAGGGHVVTANVSNTSGRDGDEVAQLYLTSRPDPTGAIRQLKGFQRVHIAARQSLSVQFMLTAQDVQGSACMVVSVGGGQPLHEGDHVEGVLRMGPECMNSMRKR